MFNRNTGIILAIALAAGLGLLLAQKVFGPANKGTDGTSSILFYGTPRTLPDFDLLLEHFTCRRRIDDSHADCRSVSHRPVRRA